MIHGGDDAVTECSLCRLLKMNKINRPNSKYYSVDLVYYSLLVCVTVLLHDLVRSGLFSSHQPS